MKKLFKGLTLIALVLFLYGSGSVNGKQNSNLIETVEAAQGTYTASMAQVTKGDGSIVQVPSSIMNISSCTVLDGTTCYHTLHTFTVGGTNALCIYPGKKMSNSSPKYKLARQFKSPSQYTKDWWQAKALVASTGSVTLDENGNSKQKLRLAAQLVSWYTAADVTDEDTLVKKVASVMCHNFNKYGGRNCDPSSAYSPAVIDAKKLIKYIKDRSISGTFYVYIHESCSSEDGCGWQPLITTKTPPPDTHNKCEYDEKNDKYYCSATKTCSKDEFVKTCYVCEKLPEHLYGGTNGLKQYADINGNRVKESEFKESCGCHYKTIDGKTHYYGKDGSELTGSSARKDYIKACLPKCTSLDGLIDNGKGKYTDKNGIEKSTKDALASCSCYIDKNTSPYTFYRYDGKESNEAEWLEKCSCAKHGDTYLGPDGAKLSNFESYQKKCSCKSNVKIDKLGKTVNCLQLKSDGTTDCSGSYTENDVKNSCSCKVINNVFYGKNGRNILSGVDEFVEKCGCDISTENFISSNSAKKQYIDKQKTCSAECQLINGTYYLKNGDTSEEVEDFYAVCNPKCKKTGDYNGYDSNGNKITSTTSYYGWNLQGEPVSQDEWIEECKSCIAVNNIFYDATGNVVDMEDFIKDEVCGCNLSSSYLGLTGEIKNQYEELQKTCNSDNKCKVVDGIFYDKNGYETDDIYEFFESCNPTCKKVPDYKGFDYSGKEIKSQSNDYDFDDGGSGFVYGYGNDNRPVDKTYFVEECDCPDCGGGGGAVCERDENGYWHGIDGAIVASEEEMRIQCNNPTCKTDITGNLSACSSDKSNHSELHETVNRTGECKEGYTEEGDNYYGSFEKSLGSGEYCKLYCLSDYSETYPGKIGHSVNVGRFIVWPNNINDTEEKIKYNLEIYPFEINYKKTCRVVVDRKKVIKQFQSEDALYNAVKNMKYTTTTGREVSCYNQQDAIRSFIKAQNEQAYFIPDQEDYARFFNRCMKATSVTDSSGCGDYCSNWKGPGPCECTGTQYTQYEFRSDSCKEEYDTLFEKADGWTWVDLAEAYSGYANDAGFIRDFYNALHTMDNKKKILGLDIIALYAGRVRSLKDTVESDNDYASFRYVDYGSIVFQAVASYQKTCIGYVTDIEENGYEIDSSSNSSFYGGIAKQDVIDELNNCIPNDSDIDVNFSSEPTIYYNDPEYGGSYNTKKRGSSTSPLSASKTISSLSSKSGEDVLNWINELESTEYSKSKSETYDLGESLFNNIYIDDGLSSNESKEKAYVKLGFSNLPISYDAKPSEQYSLKVESNIYNINEKMSEKINARDYTCQYEVTKGPDCYCPNNTKQAGKDLSSYILAHQVTCAQAQDEDCGDENKKLYCIDKNDQTISCDDVMTQEECNKKCNIDKCPEDTDYAGKMSYELAKCVASSGEYKKCVDTVCHKSDCSVDICPKGDNIPRCPYSDPNIPEENQGMDISACVNPKVATGVPLAEAYEICKDITCPGKKIIYRVIDLTNPFPSKDANIDSIDDSEPKYGVFNTNVAGRYPGYNWRSETVVKSKIIKNRKVNNDEVYSKNPIYKFTLTPEVMKNIRNYNDKQNDKNKGYADFTLNCYMNGNAACKMNSEFTQIFNGNMSGDCLNATGNAFYTCMYGN